MGRVNWRSSIAFCSFYQSCVRHALAQSAFLDKGAFQSAKQLVEKIVGLVDKADEDVRHCFRGPGFEISSTNGKS
ncbi:MAG: hypothetical protein JWM99_181 [Verrucomicrobiales bacterium]|nr:hypothetical protein [Verrucomicrobiales bacterium]